ncbi:MAG: glycosyltransferase family 4 protein [Candidatus Zixiibacteriota bacterium]
MKDYNIAFICPSKSWGGLEMNVFRLAKWLTGRGHHIILYGYPGSTLYDSCEKEGIAVRGLRSKSKLGDIFLAFSLARQLRRDNARIAVFHLNKNMILMALTKVFAGRFLRIVYMQHMHVGPSKRDIFHTWLYGCLSAWITPLDWLARAVREKTRIEPSKVRVIPLGIEVDRFTDKKPGKQLARKLLGVPKDVVIAGVVGRLDPRKGQHILIEACRKVHDRGHKLHLLLVGDPSLNEYTGYDETLRKLTVKLGLDACVHFKPHLDNIEYAYAAMDIFALTSKSETYGMVTLEAMASGLPIIATAEGGTLDIIQHESNGLLVKPYDPVELADALDRILRDNDLAVKLASKAQSDAESTYSNTRQCELLESLFDEILTDQES